MGGFVGQHPMSGDPNKRLISTHFQYLPKAVEALLHPTISDPGSPWIHEIVFMVLLYPVVVSESGRFGRVRRKKAHNAGGWRLALVYLLRYSGGNTLVTGQSFN